MSKISHNVELLDSTLREGEQTPGVCFTIKEKLEIAQAVDEFGVDIVEAGHPAVSDEIKSAVRQVAGLGLSAEVLGHCRAMKSDIDAAIDCDVDWVGIFFCLTDKALEQRFRKNIEEASTLIAEVVSYAKSHGLKVRYTPEDTVRSDFANVVRAARAAKKAGADRVSVADTAGVMTPLKMYHFIERLRKEVGIELNVHCHNDLGLAVANALTAVEAGARLIDVCVNGLGERAGIASLAEVAVALRLRYGSTDSRKLEMLPRLADLVAGYSRIPVAVQAPIVGQTAFTHNAGLHVAAVLMDPSHYESIPADLVGRDRDVVVDKMAGRPTIDYKLKRLKIHLTDEETEEVFQSVKRLRKRTLTDAEFRALTEEVRQRGSGPAPQSDGGGGKNGAAAAAGDAPPRTG